MESILTDNQILLMGYLKEVGCKKGTVFTIMTDLWEEEQVIEMLQYCKEHPNAGPTELLRTSSEIYSRYKEI